MSIACSAERCATTLLCVVVESWGEAEKRSKRACFQSASVSAKCSWVPRKMRWPQSAGQTPFSLHSCLAEPLLPLWQPSARRKEAFSFLMVAARWKKVKKIPGKARVQSNDSDPI